MQDSNFDNFFHQQLSTTQSFEIEDGDWEVVAQRLDEVLPQESRRKPVLLIVISTIAILGLLGYLSYQLGESNKKIEQMEMALKKAMTQKNNQPIAATPSMDTDNDHVNTTTTSNENIANTSATTLIEPAKVTASYNTTPTVTDKNTQPIVIVEKQEEKQTPVTASANAEQNNTEVITSTTSQEKTIINTEKPIATATNTEATGLEIIDTLAIAANEHDLAKPNKLGKVLEAIKPIGYSVGLIGGRGVSRNQFEKQPHGMLQGTYNAGIKGEALFSKYVRLEGRMQYLNQTLVYHETDASKIPVTSTPPTSDFYLDKIIANQTFLEGSIGVKCVVNPYKKFNAYVGVGIPVQYKLTQEYDFQFNHATTDDIENTPASIKPNNELMFTSIKLNGGVEYHLFENVSLQLEGTYNHQLPEKGGFVPDLFSLNIGVAYNLPANI